LELAEWQNTPKMAVIMKSKPTTKHNAQDSGRKLGAQTKAIHAGEGVRHGVGGPVRAPICRTSTLTLSSTAEMKRWAEDKSGAYIYTRYGNSSKLAIA
jgi:cystathionine beta-lyase/cystathionine gamma-synthase